MKYSVICSFIHSFIYSFILLLLTFLHVSCQYVSEKIHARYIHAQFLLKNREFIWRQKLHASKCRPAGRQLGRSESHQPAAAVQLDASKG